MKVHQLVSVLAGTFAFAALTAAQTTTTGFAPSNFGDRIYTAMPSGAPNSDWVSSIFGSNGTTATVGSGGMLENTIGFTYQTTGPNTATVIMPASGSNTATTTDLIFTSANGGTYSTTRNGIMSTGNFSLTSLPSAAALVNVSVRSTLSPNETATVGFVVGGTMPRQVMIRAIGPGLTSLGVTNALANPSMTLYRGSQALATNDDWGTAATPGSSGNNANINPTLATAQMFTQLGAFGLTTGSQDSAVVVTLQPGAYTVQLMNTAPGTGTGAPVTGDVLLEVYFMM